MNIWSTDMKVLMNEQQVNTLILEQCITNSFLLTEERDLGALVDKIMKYVMRFNIGVAAVIGAIRVNQDLTASEKDYVEQEIVCRIGADDYDEMNVDTVPMKRVDFNDASDDEWRCISFNGEITVYNAVANQCNDDTNHTASMFELDMERPQDHRIVAMDREFMKYHGIKFGDIIKIDNCGKQSGVYQVQDLMNARYAMQPKVDVLSDYNTKYGGSSGHARIFVLKNKKNASNYKKNMKKSLNGVFNSR